MANSITLTGLNNLIETQHQLDWQFFKEGIEILPLTYHTDGKPASALLRYQAGANVPRHKHPGYEHIFVLEGSQRDENGLYQKGSLLISPPGSYHSVTSEQGCIVLAIWEKTVEFVDG